MALCDDVRNAMGNHTGLAAAGAGKNQQGAFRVGYRFALLRVEAFEKIHERGTQPILARTGPISSPCRSGFSLTFVA
jgi:hypothetical protein